MILIAVKFPVRPELVEEWPERVAAFTEATRAEPGNVFFEWSRSLDEPNTYVLLEGFADAEAGKAHVESDHFKAGLEAMAGAISATPSIINVDAPVDGWGEMAELSPQG